MALGGHGICTCCIRSRPSAVEHLTTASFVVDPCESVQFTELWSHILIAGVATRPVLSALFNNTMTVTSGLTALTALAFGRIIPAAVAYYVIKFLYQAIYYRFFHELSKFPGPFWASATRSETNLIGYCQALLT